MIRKTIVVIFAVVSLLVIGYFSASKLLFFAASGHYKTESVRIISEGVTDDGIVVEYALPGETLYSSPGIQLSRTDSGVLNVYVSRIHIDDDWTSVDIRSTTNERGNQEVLIPHLPTADRPISILINGEKSLGEWATPNDVTKTD